MPLETQGKLKETKTRNRQDENYLPAVKKAHRLREILNLIKKQTNVLLLKPYDKNTFQLGPENCYICA